MNRYRHPPLRDALAAEYALGTLQGYARRRFERLLENDSALREQVEDWHYRINQLAADSAPVEPPAELWPKLQRRIAATSSAGRPQRWYENLAFWRGLTIASGLLAIVLAALLVVTTPPPSPGYVVILNDQATREPVWTVSASADMERFHVRNLKPMTLPQGRGCLLWVQPRGSEQTYPIGLLPDDGSETTLIIEQRLRELLVDGKLLVTVEDKQEPVPITPTGPTEFTGQLVPLTRI